MERMSRFFVEERDPLFKKGKLEGKLEKARQFVRSLIAEGSYNLPKIARLVDVPLDFVLQIKAELEAKKQHSV